MVGRVMRHVRRVWPEGGAWAPLTVVAWPAWNVVRDTMRAEHLAFTVLIVVLAYATPRSKALFIGLLPFAILALVYDAMRYVQYAGVEARDVHTCDLAALDARLFPGDGTAHDYLQLRATALVDRLAAVPYGTFLYVSLGVAVWLYGKDYEALLRFGWTFLIVNLAGFVTYHLYPAAPPWYVHRHGCAVDLTAHASEGPNLARVDAWLGVQYFAGFYGRSSDVFGAMPSLHVSYPLLNIIFGWSHWTWLGRSLAIGFFAAMCFAAVYLDHHWVIDVVMGVVYTVVVERAVAWLWQRRRVMAESFSSQGSQACARGAE